MRLSLHDVDYIEMQLKCNNAHAGVAACRLRISIYLFVTVKWLVENGNFVCIWLLLGNRKAWNEGLEVRNKLKYDVDWVAALLFLFHAWVPVCYAYGGSQQVAQRARTLAADWMEEATPPPQPHRTCAIYNIHVAKGFSNLIRLSSVVPLPIYGLLIFMLYIFYERLILTNYFGLQIIDMFICCPWL